MQPILLKIGIVQTRDSDTHTVTVRWPDSGTTSGLLHVIRTGAAWMPAIGDAVLVGYPNVPDADGFVLGAIQ